MDPTRREMTKIAREVNKFIVNMMREDGIGTAEIDLIHLIRKNPGITQAEARSRLHIDKGAAARRVANLEAKGFLIRKANPADGRSQLLYATAKADAFKNSKAHMEACFYEWLYCCLSDEELTVFSNILHKLYLRCKDESICNFAHVTADITQRIDQEELYETE